MRLLQNVRLLDQDLLHFQRSFLAHPQVKFVRAHRNRKSKERGRSTLLLYLLLLLLLLLLLPTEKRHAPSHHHATFSTHAFSLSLSLGPFFLSLFLPFFFSHTLSLSLSYPFSISLSNVIFNSLSRRTYVTVSTWSDRLF